MFALRARCVLLGVLRWQLSVTALQGTSALQDHLCRRRARWDSTSQARDSPPVWHARQELCAAPAGCQRPRHARKASCARADPSRDLKPLAQLEHMAQALV